jgi:hypothetical protein
LRESMHELSEQVRRLSEEVALSWWILNQYSDLLQKPLSQVNLLSYVLAAAAEAAARTTILPPALSMPALIAKSLKGCKQSRVKDIALLALFQESDSVSVVLEQHPMDHGEPTRILLVSSILGRIREFNDASLAVSTTTRFFPGTKSDMQVAPSRVATQYYDELVFLSSLSQLHGEV